MSPTRTDLTTAGDGLQSAASRLAEWVREMALPGRLAQTSRVPYEVAMAALEAEDYVHAWTKVRSS